MGSDTVTGEFLIIFALQRCPLAWVIKQFKVVSVSIIQFGDLAKAAHCPLYLPRCHTAPLVQGLLLRYDYGQKMSIRSAPMAAAHLSDIGGGRWR